MSKISLIDYITRKREAELRKDGYVQFVSVSLYALVRCVTVMDLILTIEP